MPHLSFLLQTFESPSQSILTFIILIIIIIMMKKKKMQTNYTTYCKFLLPPSMASFLLLILLSCLCFIVSSSAIAVSGDARNLLAFKSTLPNPETLSNWQSGENPCLFAGVFCSSVANPYRVTSLDLSSLPISSDFASVATHLFVLDELVSLKLASTNLSGELRPFPSCSSSLSHIDLSVNSLSGSPSDFTFFSACGALSTLNLSSNRIDSAAGSFTPSSKYSLAVQTLDVSGNRLAGSGFLPWLLSTGCAHLSYLSLRANKLAGAFSLDGCDKLQHFDVSGNNFSSPMPGLGACKQLTHLDLSSNKFTGLIGDELVVCAKLTFLNFSSNEFSGPIPALPSGSLQFLNLSGNHFEGGIHGGRNSLIQACNSLVEVDLSFNLLSGNIPEELESCSSVEQFHVSNNNLSGELPVDVLMKMSGLKKLDLSSNIFVGALPETLLLQSGLESLDLSSNNISGNIPSGFCENESTSLRELYLQDNLLTGAIPSDLVKCSQLVSLDLSFNYLTGKIPPGLGFLSNLKDLILSVNSLEGEIPQELMNLKSLENLILDYNKLTGNLPPGLRNCSKLHWMSLASNRLSGLIPSWIGGMDKLAILKLSNNSFYGNIPPELGDCKSLLWLDLHTNLLNGTIPPSIAKQSGYLENTFVVGKEFAYLKNNGSKECHGAGNLLFFPGIREDSLNRIPNRHICNFTRVYKGITQPSFQHNGTMMFLGLSHNMLEGSIPKEIGTMSYLLILDLSHNALSGPIPGELDGLENVGVMDLSYNHLSGQIPPSLGKLTLLIEIDLSNNNLSGMIPASGQFETFPAFRYYNNSGLCGYPLENCQGLSPGSGSQHQRRQRQGTLIGSVAMGLLFSFFCVFGVIIVYIELKKRRRKLDSTLGEYPDVNSSSGNHTGWKLTSTREALSINLATFEKPLWKLTFADLLEATNGFHNDAMIGSGGFGDVYKAKLKDGSVVAIKKLIHVSGQGDREFTAEMETIGKVKHRNLVPLLGYCKVGEERLLVYEYMQHGSLEDVLHDRKKAGIKLSWTTRRKIAVGAARGLAFLHHNCIPHIIHRDMKSSNVLLDVHLEARVSDFGMARLMSAMDTHLSVSTLAGTPGYVPPEYYQSFRCSTKGDVYSYGVVLLELLTGRQPTDSADFGDNNLVGWVKQHARTRISDVFDPELMKEDPGLEVELLQHLKVACACLDDRPWKRPSMIQVMAMFKEIQAGSGLENSGSTIAAAGSLSTVEDVADRNDDENEGDP